VPNLFFLATVGILVLFSVALSRMPLALARCAVFPVGKRVALPLPATVAALVLRPQEGAMTYRQPPDRKLVLAALPGDAHILREDELLRFVHDRNWVLARPRARLGSMTLVRVEVAAAEGGLVLWARHLPADVFLPVLVAVWFASLSGSLLVHPLSLALGCLTVVIGLAQHQKRARACFRAVIEEMTRRITALEGGSPTSTSTSTSATSAATARTQPGAAEDGGGWTCACGMRNDARRKTCRRCWAQNPRVP
jgi:hypothetical protein